MNARIKRFSALLTVAVLQIGVEAHATDRQRKAADAIPTAMCVRKAILKADAELKTTPGDNVTEDVRKQLLKEFEVSDAVARTEVKLCLSADDVYSLGWYEQMDTSQLVPECGLRTTEALVRYNRKDDADTDLLNGATKWATFETIETHPFFKAQAESHQHIRNTPRLKVCEELLRDFGPNGLRFPGLVRR